MTKEELAAQLHGCVIGSEVSYEQHMAAQAAGLVIVYGASDDLMRFEGAIDDELDAYQGASVTVDAKGILPVWQDLNNDDRRDIDLMRDWFSREGKGRVVKAVWGDSGIAWTYETDIPHATFDVTEDGAVWCRGIVFSLAELAP